jgi:glycosyltransferase involved in cell wall biosynthesis
MATQVGEGLTDLIRQLAGRRYDEGSRAPSRALLEASRVTVWESVVSLTYAIITPTRNEAESLPRLAGSLERQTRLPSRWLIAENGSTDRTVEVATSIAADCAWARLLVLPGAGPRERGAPIVRALHSAIDVLDVPADVVVNVDADVTMGPDYFERLLEAFERDPRLGIASGSAWEQHEGVWRQRFVTGGTVWGATRAYRWACLQDVLPLEERHGWDGIDQLKARARGWHTKTLVDLPFRHHRPEGREDGSSWAHWVANGDTAYFMGYRPWYLLARTLHRARRDLAAVGLVYGYVSAAVRRVPRLDDPGARAMLRGDQSFTKILRRRREALGLPELSE